MKTLLKYTVIILLMKICVSCNSTNNQQTFEQDLAILKEIGDIEILTSEDAMIAVSGKIQGRVFTSSSNGLNGTSYGYFNRKAIKNNHWKSKFSSLGGEDRLWFGPQFGDYSIFFDSNKNQNTDDAIIAKDLDTIAFQTIEKTEKYIVFNAQMNIKNFSNFNFKLDVLRKVSILDSKEIERNLYLKIPSEVSTVAFETKNTIKNIGNEMWNKQTGLLSIWNLGCMLPSKNSIVFIPTKGDSPKITNYFTPIDDSRLKIIDGIIYYKADAEYLNKIGTLPENTLPIFGSYNPELNLLTIVEFTFNENGVFVDSNTGVQKNPYAGDVINIFNDGVYKGGGPFGPFFELETSSDSKELHMGEGQSHTHKTYHFEGNEIELSKITQQLFGISINEINSIFNN